MIAPRRLLVLVPDRVSDDTKVAQRIASLALQHHLSVLLLAVIESADQEPATYRCLINLSSFLKALSIDSETKLATGGSWIGAVQEVLQAGDQIVCHAEQTIIDCDMNKVPLSNALSIALDTPIIVISGLYQAREARQRTRLSEIKWWGVALIIVIALCGIMYLISQTTSGWVENALLLSAFLIAILMIWFWNKRG